MIQELDLQNFDARFFRLELLKRCPELRHLRLPRRFTDSHAQRLQVLIPVYCRNLEGVHVEQEASSMDVLPYLLDAIPVLRYLSVSCRKLNALSYGVVDAVIQTTQYRWLETVIIKNAGSLDTPLGVVVSLLERCTNLKVFVTDIKEMGFVLRRTIPRVLEVSGDRQEETTNDDRAHQRVFFEKTSQQTPRLKHLVL
ncbi:hypothetical protein BGX23_012800 [Mortierella sp. AD031]|nr:hypothetical protein BGX23_012800 [Mortierella sp. AD031]